MVLRHVADLSTAEVARAMGVAEGTVAAHLHRARARLRAEPDTATNGEVRS
ncbi:MAG: sigma-70 region 4 domain-containing protein [Actinobacteria bacterium]|nr:sigma-70 region 4 domain-containing protein [Actinomycetota bacterium]